MVSHPIVNLENVTGDPVENGKLRKGIRTHRHHGNEYGEIANNHAEKDSPSHVVHGIFQIEREALLIGSKFSKKESHHNPFASLILLFLICQAPHRLFHFVICFFEGRIGLGIDHSR
jgi:hypothetical protein